MGASWVGDGEEVPLSLGFKRAIGGACASCGLVLTPPQLTLLLLSHPQQLNAIIAASMSIKSSDKLRQILEVRAQGKGLGGRVHP